MEISEHIGDNVLVLAVNGRLDSNNAAALEDRLCERMKTVSSVGVDLAETQYVSSAGLRVLLKAAKIAQGCGHKLVLCGMSAHVREVFDVSGFSRIFEIHDDREQALRTLRSSGDD